MYLQYSNKVTHHWWTSEEMEHNVRRKYSAQMLEVYHSSVFSIQKSSLGCWSMYPPESLRCSRGQFLSSEPNQTTGRFHLAVKASKNNRKLKSININET